MFLSPKVTPFVGRTGRRADPDKRAERLAKATGLTIAQLRTIAPALLTDESKPGDPWDFGTSEQWENWTAVAREMLAVAEAHRLRDANRYKVAVTNLLARGAQFGEAGLAIMAGPISAGPISEASAATDD